MDNAKNSSILKSTTLFSTKRKTYFLLDGASCPDFIPQSRKYKPEHVCLHRGELDDEMQFVAPYLIRLEKDSPFTNWILDNSFGQHWGVFAISSARMVEVRKHFRSLTMVDSPEGKPIYFRFYDPRVFNDFFPTCTPNELARIFGPIDYFLCEHIDEEKNKSAMLQHRAPIGAEAKRGTLKIRQAQMNEMGRKQEAKFISQQSTRLKNDYATQLAAIPIETLRTDVVRWIEGARTYNIQLHTDVHDWLTWKIVRGPTFEQNSDAQSILCHRQILDGTARILKLKALFKQETSNQNKR